MRAALLLLLALPLPLGGCRQEMARQPRYDTEGRAALWPDGAAARPLPEGVVAEGDAAWRATAVRPAMTEALLSRGQAQYDVFCTPCHGLGGDGDGMVVQRGFPRPPSYHSARLRAAPAQHVYDVISQGYGVMYAYASRIPPADRWAIAAYVRALQLSRQVGIASVPDARQHLP